MNNPAPTVHREQREHWDTERRWLIGIFFMLFLQIGGGFWWAGSVDRRLTYLEGDRTVVADNVTIIGSRMGNVETRQAVTDAILVRTSSDMKGLQDDIKDLSNLLRSTSRGITNP